MNPALVKTYFLDGHNLKLYMIDGSEYEVAASYKGQAMIMFKLLQLGTEVEDV